MARGFSDNAFVRVVNGLAVTLTTVPVIGGLIRRRIIEIRYLGRKSGKTFELPVGYRRSGIVVTIGVSMPDKKNWWRNFLGEGGSITLLKLDGADRTGHAVADRGSNGRVKVTVELD
ncbi:MULTISPECIES: hypothetical protein [unclassified Mycobacterium]|uniref:hypothetical protein n=1 Tax=unclassified Mycobacterium TaxID=2642494 RepID=UPI0029C9A778|nr:MULTISPECIES: hypothetical protein [unclassified Mycobacterium]